MNKHQLQNNIKTSVDHQCTKQMRPGISSLPILFKAQMKTVIYLLRKNVKSHLLIIVNELIFLLPKAVHVFEGYSIG